MTRQLQQFERNIRGVYLHDNKKVKHQDERSQECSGDLVTWQKSTIQLVPADPISSDDKHNDRGQGKQNRPARVKKIRYI